MCGFAGVVTWDEKYRVTRDTLEKMSRAIAHRGPDGEGYHLTRENEPITPDTPQIGLAFRRLAILDPDPRSNQPFHIGPLTLVFNGEIYNFRELKSEISNLRPDYRWRTTGDTEVLLMAYEVWREKCVEKLNGMFAFAVWDENKKELFVARDRMGQKPLYVSASNEHVAVAFASEIGGLRELQWTGTGELKSRALQSYLRYGYTEREPYDRGLESFSPSGTRHFGCDFVVHPTHEFAEFCEVVDGHSYWHLRSADPVDDAKAISESRRLVETAVARQLVSDVGFGIFLSGGIDSSVIACCAKRQDAVHTFSIAFDDPRYDESQYARQVASHLGTNHHEFRVTPKMIEDLPRLAKVFGEPFADSSAIPTHYLARETSKVVKVALSGDGGDELFGGYERYTAMQWSSGVRPRFAISLAAGIAQPFARGHPKSLLTRAARFLSSLNLEPSARYDSYVRIFDDRTISALLCHVDQSHNPTVEERFRLEVVGSACLVRAAISTDLEAYLPNDLLTKIDRCSMLHGLEVRSPFMDHELVQFAAGLTTDQLLKGGPKRMLREAFAKDLPDFVFKRKKMGFAVPIGEWFRGELRPMLRDNLFAANAFGRTHFNMKVVERLVEEHETQRVDHSQRLYALLMLELWWQQQVKT